MVSIVTLPPYASRDGKFSLIISSGNAAIVTAASNGGVGLNVTNYAAGIRHTF